MDGVEVFYFDLIIQPEKILILCCSMDAKFKKLVGHAMQGGYDNDYLFLLAFNDLFDPEDVFSGSYRCAAKF
jgi:hypothetical protein